jgi:hypothetical protein
MITVWVFSVFVLVASGDATSITGAYATQAGCITGRAQVTADLNKSWSPIEAKIRKQTTSPIKRVWVLDCGKAKVKR